MLIRGKIMNEFGEVVGKYWTRYSTGLIYHTLYGVRGPVGYTEAGFRKHIEGQLELYLEDEVWK